MTTPSPDPFASRRLAPLADSACLVVFVFAGAGQHDVDEGVGWFLTVLWPLVVAWFACALLARLYSSSDRVWLRLAVTLVAGALLNAVLRGSFTDRPYVSVYTLVLIAWMALTTFGWRVLARRLSTRRERLRADG